jgi:phosphate butyryltransferase
MTSNILPAVETICSFQQLRERASLLGPKRVGIVQAEDEAALEAAYEALRTHIAKPVLIGDVARIREMAQHRGLWHLIEHAELIHAPETALTTAIGLARDSRIDMLMKGHIRTDQFFHAIFKKESGLRTGKLFTDVAFFEHPDKEEKRLVGITDVAINVSPNLEKMKQIVFNAIEAMACMGMRQPKIAIMSAAEVVSEAIRSTTEARKLTEMGQNGVFGDALVFGPLALDNALYEWAARAKGIDHPVAGHADCLVVPTVEAGNLLVKAIIFVARLECAHIVVGAKVPILITSRVENAQDKVNTIALGVLYAGRTESGV